MNILVLTSSYPRFDGDPTAPFIESLVKHTAQLGHEVHLVVPEHRAWDRPPDDNGVTFHPYRYSPLREWTPWGFSQSLQGGTRLRRSLYGLAPLVGISGVRTCNAVARTSKIDVVHAHWVIPNGPIAAVAARRVRLPLIITVHGSDVALAERSRWARNLARWSIRHADATTAASRHLLDRVASLRSGRETLELVPLGSDVATFHPDEASAARMRKRLRIGPEDVLVFGIGRLVKQKGFDYLIRAIALVRQRAANVLLVVAGDGDMRHELIELSRSLGLADTVTFVGAVQRHDVPAYFAAADVVAVRTVDEEGFVEGLGYVALEAHATGKPVVASRVGGLPEVVQDRETGLLVSDRDPGALANAILVLAQDPELRRHLGDNARARALAAPGWDAVARMWIDLYERIIERRISSSDAG